MAFFLKLLKNLVSYALLNDYVSLFQNDDPPFQDILVKDSCLDILNFPPFPDKASFLPYPDMADFLQFPDSLDSLLME